jgi:hypothetical protein
MSEQQQRFDDLMKKVIKVKPDELRQRLKAEKTTKQPVNGGMKRTFKNG